MCEKREEKRWKIRLCAVQPERSSIKTTNERRVPLPFAKELDPGRSEVICCRYIRHGQSKVTFILTHEAKVLKLSLTFRAALEKIALEKAARRKTIAQRVHAEGTAVRVATGARDRSSAGGGRTAITDAIIVDDNDDTLVHHTLCRRLLIPLSASPGEKPEEDSAEKPTSAKNEKAVASAG